MQILAALSVRSHQRRQFINSTFAYRNDNVLKRTGARTFEFQPAPPTQFQPTPLNPKNSTIATTKLQIIGCNFNDTWFSSSPGAPAPQCVLRFYAATSIASTPAVPRSPVVLSTPAALRAPVLSTPDSTPVLDVPALLLKCIGTSLPRSLAHRCPVHWHIVAPLPSCPTDSVPGTRLFRSAQPRYWRLRRCRVKSKRSSQTLQALLPYSLSYTPSFSNSINFERDETFSLSQPLQQSA